MKEKYFTSTYHPISSTEAEHGLVTAEGEEVQLKLRADRNPDTGELQFEITVLNADALDFPDDFARLIRSFTWGMFRLWMNMQSLHSRNSEDGFVRESRLYDVADRVDYVFRHPEYDFKYFL